MARQEHAAKKWVEDNFPAIQGSLKAVLILAYGAGHDAGLREGQQIIEATLPIVPGNPQAYQGRP